METKTGTTGLVAFKHLFGCRKNTGQRGFCKKLSEMNIESFCLCFFIYLQGVRLTGIGNKVGVRGNRNLPVAGAYLAVSPEVSKNRQWPLNIRTARAPGFCVEND